MKVVIQLELIMKYFKTAFKDFKYSQGFGCIISLLLRVAGRLGGRVARWPGGWVGGWLGGGMAGESGIKANLSLSLS